MHSPESLSATAGPGASEDTATAPVPAAPSAVLDVPVWSAKQAWGWSAATFVFVAALLVWGLWRFGIWDPWELNAADTARRLAAGEPAAERFVFGPWLVSLGFRSIGVYEWAGRLPIALAGLVAVACAFQLGRRFGDARTGVYAALIAGTTPLLLFNARLMLGTAPDIAVQSVLGLCVLSLLLPAAEDRDAAPAWPWFAAALAAAALTLFTRGALLGALPPLAAGVCAAWLEAGVDHSGGRGWQRRVQLVLLSALAVAGLLLIARDVVRDAPEYSRWLGGKASSQTPPTFDWVIEQVFHAFAPWSAWLPIALSRTWLFEPAPEARAQLAQRSVQAACVLWLALGYAAQTLFLSRYGREVSFLPVVPLALLVALLLRDLERQTEAAWGVGIALLLLCGLLLRDFLLYPIGPVRGLPLSGFELPKVWNPQRWVSGVLIAFAVCAALACLASPADRDKPDWLAPYRFLRAQWNRGRAFKAWLIALALVLVGLCVFGILAYAIPRRLHLPSLALKFARRATYAPLALAGGVAAGQLVLWLVARLGSHRFVPVLLAGAFAGGYFAQGYLPALSEHFSPREVYSTYNQLAGPNEPLGEYRVGGRAAAYYAKGEVVEITNVSQLIDHLNAGGQRWAAFPNDDLAEIDRSFRAKSGRHLVVVDARSARVVLAAAQPVAQREDENFLSRAVGNTVPENLQHPVLVDFDARVELLGYDLKLPHETYVGAGEAFTLTWYFRTLRRIPSGYRLFVHIDGNGQRIHGDHDPVSGKYPVQLWEAGDIITDEQRIDVPASSRAGDYTIYMGFYSGDTRLPIQRGPNAGEDRARVGALRIQ